MVLPWAIYLLGLRPVFARNRLLVYNVLKCYLAVFAPPLPVTSTVVHCPGMSSKRAKGTIFAKSASFANASYKGKTHARKCKAAKTNNTDWFYKGFACSKDGLKAQQAYSPEQRSGYSWPSILRSERAKGRWEKGHITDSCCAYSAPIS